MDSLTIHRVLYRFHSNQRIAPRELKKSIDSYNMGNYTKVSIDDFIREGWLIFYKSTPNWDSDLQFMDDGYYTLTQKTKNVFR